MRARTLDLFCGVRLVNRAVILIARVGAAASEAAEGGSKRERGGVAGVHRRSVSRPLRDGQMAGEVSLRMGQQTPPICQLLVHRLAAKNVEVIDATGGADADRTRDLLNAISSKADLLTSQMVYLGGGW
jgi:hypothetical protein